MSIYDIIRPIDDLEVKHVEGWFVARAKYKYEIVEAYSDSMERAVGFLYEKLGRKILDKNPRYPTNE